jgi:CubicO group peptidase (beta-lactamase class C family)
VTGAIESIADLVDRFRRARRLPAAGAALVHATGTPVVVVSGDRVRGGGVPVTAADSWHIGSCMKSMTATAVARFVQRGELDWSTPVGDLLPGIGRVHAGWRRVTLADVLTHTAGVPANPTVAGMRAALSDPTPAPEQRIRLARHLLSRSPVRPGRFVYSNLGYTVVGAALERLTGEPFETVLTTEVLHPLGITGGGFGPPGPDQPWGHRARVAWHGLGVGRGPAIDPASSSTKHPPDNPALITPAGRLHLPLADWAAFVRTFLVGADTPADPGLPGPHHHAAGRHRDPAGHGLGGAAAQLPPAAHGVRAAGVQRPVGGDRGRGAGPYLRRAGGLQRRSNPDAAEHAAACAAHAGRREQQAHRTPRRMNRRPAGTCPPCREATDTGSASGSTRRSGCRWRCSACARRRPTSQWTAPG